MEKVQPVLFFCFSHTAAAIFPRRASKKGKKQNFFCPSPFHIQATHTLLNPITESEKEHPSCFLFYCTTIHLNAPLKKQRNR